MIKKTYIPILIAVVLSLLVSSVALAQSTQDPTQLRGGKRGIGQITALGAGQFTVESRQGEEHIIYVDENTRYRRFDGSPIEFADLQVGDWVAGILRYDPEREGPLARLIILLPDDYDPSQRLGIRARGKVIAVDEGASTFSLHIRSGAELTFTVNAHTVFKGGVTSLAELEEGMLAAVAGVKQADGSLLAQVVFARKPLVRLVGEVKTVDLVASSFTLDTRRGKEVSILVVENTKFRSRDGQVDGLEDLQAGMHAAVWAIQVEAGSFEARTVLVGPIRTP